MSVHWFKGSRMAAERKLDDDSLARLRHLAEDKGWSHQVLSDAFGVSSQHVGRLVRGEQRPVFARVDASVVGLDVGVAVDEFVAKAELTAGDVVLAATARTLASKLDACARSDSAASAQAMPRLCAQLVDLLGRLEAGVPREPDALDLLRQRRQARLLERATAGGEGAGAAAPPTGGRHESRGGSAASPRQSPARAKGIFSR
jgi:transcriptional regulator with XRE-family HTH domain